MTLNQKGKRFIIYSFIMWIWLFSLSFPTLISSQTTSLVLSAAPAKERVITDHVVLSAAGDCTLGTDEHFGRAGTLPDVLAAHNNDYNYIFQNVAPIFAAGDFTTVNLETTLTHSHDFVAKTFVFRGDPNYAKILKAGHIDAVNLANNHIYDYGDRGLADTKQALDDNGVLRFGEGSYLIQTIKGHRFAFLGYTGFSADAKFLDQLRQDIATVKSQGCIVIINFHWGEELLDHAIPTQTELAHYAIDSGADFIFGHHPHVLQPIEFYKGKLICYSLANFAFGGNQNPNDKDTMIVQTRFDFDQNGRLTSYGLRFIPCSISSVPYVNDYRPTPQTGEAGQRILDRLNRISPNAGFVLSNQFTTLPFEE